MKADKLFSFIRDGVRNAIIGGIEDAQEEVQRRIEGQDPLLIEAEPNGKPKRRTVPR